MLTKCNMEYNFELQKEIIEGEGQFKLLNGVPGSLKTLTLVKQVIFDAINIEKIPESKIIEKNTNYGSIKTYDLSKFTKEEFKIFHGCINTLTGSVTEEIKSRLSEYLNINFIKKGSHYIYSNDFISLNISSMDGFIHTQLLSYKSGVLDQRGDYFDLKADELNEDIKKGKLPFIITKKNEKCSHVYSDEFQDMKFKRCCLLITICLSFPYINMNIYGDILQTIYTHSIEGPLHPMIQWKNEVNAKEYNNNKCFRCPPSHIKLLEKILNQEIFHSQNAYECYNVPRAISMKKEEINRVPIMFTHPSTSKNCEAEIIATQITSSIECLMGYDTTIKPGDICIIMKKCNSNHVFHKIFERLNEFYTSINHSNKIKIFETQGDGSHNKIDWDNIMDSNGNCMKTVMISIHGDKGKGHRVVYFIGLSEKSLPLEVHIHKPEELTEVSSLNVGLTRSTDYLFIGFNNLLPSRYIKDVLSEIKREKLAICSWDNKSNIPSGFYKDNINALMLPWRSKIPKDKITYPSPLFTLGNDEPAYIENPVYMPIEPTISISSIYEELTEPEIFINLEKELVFNTDIKCELGFTQDYQDYFQPILGNMGEILYIREHLIKVCGSLEMFQQKLDAYLKFIRLLEGESIYYTENDDLINIVYDAGLNTDGMYGNTKRSKYEEIIFENKGNTKLVEEIKEIIDGMYYVILPKPFDNPKIINSIKSFKEYKKSDKLLINDIWNISLIFSIINDDIYKPCLNVYLNNPPFKYIDDLLTNINLIQDKLSIDDLDYVEYQTRHETTKTIIDKNHINRLGKTGCKELTFGLTGRSDMLDIRNKVLYDIKVPTTDTFNNGWISQVTGYLVTDIKSMKLKTESFKEWNTGGIIDITNGMVWNFHYDFKHKSKKEIFKYILEIHSIDDSVVRLF